MNGFAGLRAAYRMLLLAPNHKVAHYTSHPAGQPGAR